MLWSVRSNGPAWIFAHLHIESSGRIFSQFANWEIERPDVSIAHWEIGEVNCSFLELSQREGPCLILLSETSGRQIAHLPRRGKRDGDNFPSQGLVRERCPMGVVISNPYRSASHTKALVLETRARKSRIVAMLLSACGHLVQRSRSLFMLCEHHIDFGISRHGDDDTATCIEGHDF